VLQESTARSRLDAALTTGLTPLVGREQEVGLLGARWAQAKDGAGQVVLLSGEAGIGKSRLVHVLKEHVAQDPQAWLTPWQCSPYHQHSAFYPIIDLLQRIVLQLALDETASSKLRKLEGWLVQYGISLLRCCNRSSPRPMEYPCLWKS
jgi:predicted ATPase